MLFISIAVAIPKSCGRIEQPAKVSGFVLDHALFFGLFLGATFAAALVAGLASFAFGIVAAAAWLHVLGPRL
jgi:hypothetical protein